MTTTPPPPPPPPLPPPGKGRPKYILTDISKAASSASNRRLPSLLRSSSLAAAVAAMTHLGLTIGSLAASTRSNPAFNDDSSVGDHGDSERHGACFDAHHYHPVTNFITRLYNGQHHEISQPWDHPTTTTTTTGTTVINTEYATISTTILKEEEEEDDDDNNDNDNKDDDGVIKPFSSPSVCRLRQHQQQSPRVILASDAIFEDPAARCVGRGEIQEAFRVLTRTLQPTCTPFSPPPVCIDVQPRGAAVELHYRLDQTYQVVPSSVRRLWRLVRRPLQIVLGSTSTSSSRNNTDSDDTDDDDGHGHFRLQSLLVVTVQLQQTQSNVPESDFLVVRMQERWNGRPLWNGWGVQPFAFLVCHVSRRFNGWMSYHLTTRLVV